MFFSRLPFRGGLSPVADRRIENCNRAPGFVKSDTEGRLVGVPFAYIQPPTPGCIPPIMSTFRDSSRWRRPARCQLSVVGSQTGSRARGLRVAVSSFEPETDEKRHGHELRTENRQPVRAPPRSSRREGRLTNQLGGTRRTNRRLPTCSTIPSRTDRSTSYESIFSPSTFTAP